MFKFDLGQLIFYMRSNRVHSAPVQSRMKVDNLHEDWDSTDAQKDTFKRFGHTCTKYSTVHGQVDENEAYDTKEELLSSL